MREDFEMEEEMMRQLAKYRHRSARQMCDRNAPFGARSERRGSTEAFRSVSVRQILASSARVTRARVVYDHNGNDCSALRNGLKRGLCSVIARSTAAEHQLMCIFPPPHFDTAL